MFTLAVSTPVSLLGYVLIERCAHSEATLYGSTVTYAQERCAECFAAMCKYQCKEPKCAYGRCVARGHCPCLFLVALEDLIAGPPLSHSRM